MHVVFSGPTSALVRIVDETTTLSIACAPSGGTSCNSGGSLPIAPGDLVVIEVDGGPAPAFSFGYTIVP
jgi:hypothetical protein